MTQYKTRVMRLIVAPVTDPIYGERSTDVMIEDEAGGEFVVVTQAGADGMGKIAIAPDEWPALRAAINRMVRLCH